jgi:hypothetical protein
MKKVEPLAQPVGFQTQPPTFTGDKEDTMRRFLATMALGSLTGMMMLAGLPPAARAAMQGQGGPGGGPGDLHGGFPDGLGEIADGGIDLASSFDGQILDEDRVAELAADTGQPLVAWAPCPDQDSGFQDDCVVMTVGNEDAGYLDIISVIAESCDQGAGCVDGYTALTWFETTLTEDGDGDLMVDMTLRVGDPVLLGVFGGPVTVAHGLDTVGELEIAFSIHPSYITWDAWLYDEAGTLVAIETSPMASSSAIDCDDVRDQVQIDTQQDIAGAVLTVGFTGLVVGAAMLLVYAPAGTAILGVTGVWLAIGSLGSYVLSRSAGQRAYEECRFANRDDDPTESEDNPEGETDGGDSDNFGGYYETSDCSDGDIEYETTWEEGNCEGGDTYRCRQGEWTDAGEWTVCTEEG